MNKVEEQVNTNPMDGNGNDNAGGAPTTGKRTYKRRTLKEEVELCQKAQDDLKTLESSAKKRKSEKKINPNKKPTKAQLKQESFLGIASPPTQVPIANDSARNKSATQGKAKNTKNNPVLKAVTNPTATAKVPLQQELDKKPPLQTYLNKTNNHQNFEFVEVPESMNGELNNSASLEIKTNKVQITNHQVLSTLTTQQHSPYKSNDSTAQPQQAIQSHSTLENNGREEEKLKLTPRYPSSFGSPFNLLAHGSPTPSNQSTTLNKTYNVRSPLFYDSDSKSHYSHYSPLPQVDDSSNSMSDILNIHTSPLNTEYKSNDAQQYSLPKNFKTVMTPHPKEEQILDSIIRDLKLESVIDAEIKNQKETGEKYMRKIEEIKEEVEDWKKYC